MVTVRKLLYQYGFGNIWEEKAACIDLHPVFIKQFDQRLMDTFQQGCRSDIATSNRCSLCNRLGREFQISRYLNKVHIPSNRRAMTMLRLIADIV